MKIYDCFLYFDEEVLLEARLNILDKFVDKFVIVESKYSHRGEVRTPNFSLKKYKKFKDKIIYILLEDEPKNLFTVNKNDHDNLKNKKIIVNGNLREFYQRNSILKGLHDADKDDWIIISDVDEIPYLEKVDFSKFKKNLIFFNQIFCCYKFNLYSKMKWYGSRMIKKKKLLSPQWLRDIKDKNYPFWRIDTLFSKKKYSNIKFVENGGWHFTCIKKPEDIHNKLLTFAHHQDYECSQISLEQLKKIISEKKVLYDHQSDKKQSNKWESDKTLKKIEIQKLPSFFSKNIEKYENWLD